MAGVTGTGNLGIVMSDRFFLFDDLQVWWPECSESVLPLLARTRVVTVMQCGDTVAKQLETYAFRHRFFHTLLIDLLRPEPDLRRGMNQLCRRQIDKAERMACDIVVNEETDQVFRVINDFVRRSRYRQPISAREWQQYREHGDVFFIRHGGEVIAAHIVLVNGSERARFLLGATIDRSDLRFRDIVGPLNRLLHWSAMRYYRERGVRSYDFGGIVLEKTSPLYSIAQFKLSFGGEPVTENILRLTRHATVRQTLRLLARLKATVVNRGVS